ncbi:MAG TPA: hypothetical protein VJK29_13320, partial [Terriglobales bacterium]|nr:hypothetical protein [Terriglobales bacterium]
VLKTGSQFSVRSSQSCVCLSSQEADSSRYFVGTPGEKVQHASGVSAVLRFAENLAVHDNNGVSAENEVIRPLTEHGKGFPPCQAFGTGSRILTFFWELSNVTRLYNELNARVAQKFLAARGSGGEDDRVHLLPTVPLTDSISFAES